MNNVVKGVVLSGGGGGVEIIGSIKILVNDKRSHLYYLK